MESKIWSKSAEKWAYILMVRGHEVYCLKVTGNVLTLKRNVKAVIDALEQGQPPSDVGAKSIETLDARTLGKAEVSPGNGVLTLHGGGDGSTTLTYATADNNADEILRAILAQCGRTFQQTQEEIGVVEALLPPAIIGIIGGVFCAGVYQSAGQLAAGGELEAKGLRRRGLQRLLIWAAELLGTGGTVVVGVLLLALILGWAAKRIIHRPQRTVWLPENA